MRQTYPDLPRLTGTYWDLPFDERADDEDVGDENVEDRRTTDLRDTPEIRPRYARGTPEVTCAWSNMSDLSGEKTTTTLSLLSSAGIMKHMLLPAPVCAT